MNEVGPTIIPALRDRQQKRGGYLTDADMRAVAERLSVPLYRIQSLVTFFPHFRTTPPPPVEVHICRDMACHLRGSEGCIERLKNWAKQTHGKQVDIHGVSCLGRCDRPIASMINEQLFVLRDEKSLQDIINGFVAKTPPEPDTDLALTRTRSEPWQMDAYAGDPQYEALKQFARNPDADEVIATLERAGLLGMGGAGGRAYLKWGDVRRAKGSDKYIVCNADESEPGTFKDREILLTVPHLTVEGMILAGLTVGASRGWLYIRHEYPEQAEQFQAELDRARSLGALGRNIFGSGKSFELDIFVSPGGYICGEQTALIEAMEDKRAEPRNRPPELMTNGFRNQPTLLSNVETFAWVPAIMLRESGAWYAEQGEKTGKLVGDNGPQIKGRRLFSISGDLAKPGVYEVPTGIRLGDLIDIHAGGMKDGKEIVAVALSGPSGGLLPPRIPVRFLNKSFVKNQLPQDVTEIDIRDIPLDINVSRALGIMIGAGIVIYGTGADPIAEAIACSRFFRNESCGKCVPCRIGSQKITEAGERIAANPPPSSEWAIVQGTIQELSQVMVTTSICGLGQVASNPVMSIFKYFLESQSHDTKGVITPKDRG
jgi:formate dehydrogenase beta subunit